MLFLSDSEIALKGTLEKVGQEATSESDKKKASKINEKGRKLIRQQCRKASNKQSS